MTQSPQKTGNIVQLAIVFEAGIFLVALGFGELLDESPLKILHLNWTGLLVGTLATGPLLITMWGCSRSKFGPFEELMRQVEEQIVPLFLGASTWALLLISVLAGVGEEYLFRGVLQSGLTGWVGMPVALGVTSVLFGLAHLITPTYAVFAGLIGAFFGVLGILTGNLLVPIVTHALYDFVALKYLTRTAGRELCEQ